MTLQRKSQFISSVEQLGKSNFNIIKELPTNDALRVLNSWLQGDRISVELHMDLAAMVKRDDVLLMTPTGDQKIDDVEVPQHIVQLLREFKEEGISLKMVAALIHGRYQQDCNQLLAQLPT